MITNTENGLKIKGRFFRGSVVFIMITLIYSFYSIFKLKNKTDLSSYKPTYIVWEKNTSESVQGYTVDIMEYCRKNGGKFISDGEVLFCYFNKGK